jgi:hypothetical protein
MIVFVDNVGQVEVGAGTNDILAVFCARRVVAVYIFDGAQVTV